MERCHLPRALGAATTMVLVTVLARLGVQQALSGTADVLKSCRKRCQKLRYEVTAWHADWQGRGRSKQVQKTADELQKLAGASTACRRPRPRRASAATGAEAHRDGRARWGWRSSIGQLVSVLFLTYFLLAAGDLFRRQLMQVMDRRSRRARKRCRSCARSTSLSQRYFALVLAMNIVVGLATTAIGSSFSTSAIRCSGE
jgi:predicted PurR-regulated permease PerM